MRILTGLLLIAGIISAPVRAQNPILPQPQEITYGKAEFPLPGVSIGFTRTPSREDLFAAEELARSLSVITHSPVQIDRSGNSQPGIVLERTGAVDALPQPGEVAGPGSREAYEITVDRDGVRIKAPSSAGLYYGVQTLRQMIESSGEEAVLP